MQSIIAICLIYYMTLNLLIKNYSGYLYRHRYILLLLCTLSFLSLIDIPASPTFKIARSIQIVYLLLVSIFKGVFLLTILAPLFKTRCSRVFIWIIICFYAILSVTNAVAFHYYSMGITRKLILIFAQTNKTEALGFLPGLMQNIFQLLKNLGFFICLLIMGGLIYAVRSVPEKLFSGITLVLVVAGLFSFVAFGLLFSSGRSAHLLTIRIIKYGKEVQSANKEYEELLRHSKPLPYKDSASSSNKATNVVVVIGESAHKRHHSLYGYPLLTNPNLESFADSLIVFTDVVGSSMTTAGNMERILSFKEDDATCGDGLKFPLLVDLFNEMGYKTFWLSNQERTGTVSNTSGVMAMNANVIKYVGAENSEDALCVRYDRALLPPMCEAFNDSVANKLIFLHLLGSHVEYKARYPEEFEHFSGKDEQDKFKYSWLDDDKAKRRAEYDNSIRYTDYLLGEVILTASRCEEPSIVIYFSDHGEEVYDYGPYSGRNENTVQVPFIVYANKSYSSANPEIMKRLAEVKDKPMSTANFVHLLISLTGGEYKLYEKRLDILSEGYIVRPRYVDEKIWIYDQE